jgi:hypothetical protein
MALNRKRLAGGEAQYSTEKLYHIVQGLDIHILGMREVDWGFLHRDHGERPDPVGVDAGRREEASVELFEGARPQGTRASCERTMSPKTGIAWLERYCFRSRAAWARSVGLPRSRQ